MSAEQWLDAVLRRSPAQPLFAWRAARHLAVLAYHGVDDPAQFERHLDYLARHFHPVSLQEVVSALDGRTGLPRRAVLITFDDGERSVYEIGLPLLRSRGLPGVVFVVAGQIDTEQPLWTAEALELAVHGGTSSGFDGLAPKALVKGLKRVSNRERLVALDDLRRTAGACASPVPQLRRHELAVMESAGLSVGNHTMTHPCLPSCSPAEVEVEVRGAHQRLTAILGHPPRAFAYPNGDGDVRAGSILAELGYGTAFLFDHRLTKFPPADRFHVSRVRVNSYTSIDRLSIILSGLHPALHHLRGGR